MSDKGHVDYESFGAKGDGRTDDLPSICKAHEYANKNNLKVVSNPEANYHLGRKELKVVIATDTDWSTSRFIIDDRDIENRESSIFYVESLLQSESLEIKSLSRDQKQLDVKPSRNCYVQVHQADRLLYIRRGGNENIGDPQHDSFILNCDGAIVGDIDWDYNNITSVMVKPIDEKPLVLKGGVFTTIANCWDSQDGYFYHARNIKVSRSNTHVIDLTHYITGEGEIGHPYMGFVDVVNCANVTIQDSFFTGHKTYFTVGSAGHDVPMGSYDIHANNIVNLKLINCRMNLIKDRTRWGIAATNFCKNIVLEDCHLSRIDTHMGVSGEYIVRNSELGWVGLNAVGRGLLLIEDSVLHGRFLIQFRADYGSPWEGTVNIKNCIWTPNCGDEIEPMLFNVQNDGNHDFGYPCHMPHSINIDGLTIDDSNHPQAYNGPFLFTNPDERFAENVLGCMADRPFPYQMTKSVTVKDLDIKSGLALQVSTHPELLENIKIIEIDG